MRIFTDGSASPNPGKGGWGFSVWQNGKEVHHGCGGVRKSTNNAMELTALARALEWLRDNPVDGRVEIVSDSKYLVDGTNAWRLKWRRNGWRTSGKKSGPVKNCELWQAIDALVDELEVSVKWQRGHSGNAGNERAHNLADIGRLDPGSKKGKVAAHKPTRSRATISSQVGTKSGLGFFGALDHHNTAADGRLQAAELLLRHGDISEAVFKAVVERCHGGNGNGGSLLRSQPTSNALAKALAKLERFGNSQLDQH